MYRLIIRLYNKDRVRTFKALRHYAYDLDKFTRLEYDIATPSVIPKLK